MPKLYLSEEEKKEAVLYMWGYGLSVAKTKYNVSCQALYNWRDELIKKGVLEHISAEEAAAKLEVRFGAQTAPMLVAELEESDHSPLEYLKESLKTRMEVLRTINRLLPKAKSLRDVNDCLRALNEGIESHSVTNPLAQLPDKKSMWSATELILKHRRELEEAKTNQKAIDITHEEVK